MKKTRMRTPKAEPALQNDVDVSLAKALDVVARHDWPERARDEALSRAAFQTWMQEAPATVALGFQRDTERLAELIDQALEGLYDDQMRAALVCLLLLDRYSEARANGAVLRHVQN